jgi:serine/threonine protein kinase
MSSPGTRIGHWEVIKPLGKGGQGEVSLVRSGGRVQERQDVVREILACNPWEIRITEQERRARIERLVPALWKYARPDNDSDLGALKQFLIPNDSGPEADEALKRLQNEITVLRQGRAGLVPLIDANEKERWIVTEYMPKGTFFGAPTKYVGNAHGALKVFRSLVETAASLHKDGMVHRDVKPANVFLTDSDQLILGDFGLIFLPDQAERPTMTNERVGPRDYMPQWGDLGERLENVQPNFDVYMLGKLLWCMVTGRLKLPREYHRKPAYDVTALFPNDPNMRTIGEIIGKCVVEEPDQCLTSAVELLTIIDESLAVLDRGVPMLDGTGKLVLPCRVCGRGVYQEHYPEGHFRLSGYDRSSRLTTDVRLRVFVCNVCTHYELFAPNFPDEAAQKGWKAWRPN